MPNPFFVTVSQARDHLLFLSGVDVEARHIRIHFIFNGMPATLVSGIARVIPMCAIPAIPSLEGRGFRLE